MMVGIRAAFYPLFLFSAHPQLVTSYKLCTVHRASFIIQDDDVKVSIASPDPEAANPALGFVEGVMNCAAATVVMDMQVSVLPS